MVNWAMNLSLSFSQFLKKHLGFDVDLNEKVSFDNRTEIILTEKQSSVSLFILNISCATFDFAFNVLWSCVLKTFNIFSSLEYWIGLLFKYLGSWNIELQMLCWQNIGMQILNRQFVDVAGLNWLMTVVPLDPSHHDIWKVLR